MNNNVSRIPTPDRGQPLDVAYLYLMATAINNIADQVDTSSEKYTSVNTRDAQRQDLRTSDTKFFASFQDIYSQVEVRAGDTKEFVFPISGFKYAPIATVTPVNTGTGPAANDTLVVITSTTNSEIRGFVRFNSGGVVSVAINVIAVGVPE